MAMTVIWTGMTALSLLCALAMGNQGELASAALDGAASAIELGISMAGVLCLWMLMIISCWLIFGVLHHW